MTDRASAGPLVVCLIGAGLSGAVAGCDDNSDEAVDVRLGLDALDRLLAATPPSGRTPGTNRAIAELVRDQFREVGVEDVTIEEFSIPVSASTNHSLSFLGPPEVAGSRPHEVNIFGGDGSVSGGALIDVGLAAMPVGEAAGKVAVVDVSASRSLRTQYRNVVASGAIGAIIDSNIDTLRQRNVWSLAGGDQIDGPIPVVTIAHGDVVALRQQLAMGVDVRVDLATDAAVTSQNAYNVIARIPGTQYPERTLVVNGHLDSWFAGAADDAQAIAALIALAKVFNERPLPYTIELIAFDGEETFQLGSNNYFMRRLPEVRDVLVGAMSLQMLAPKAPILSVATVDPMDVWLPALETGGLTEVFNIALTPSEQTMSFGGEVPSDQVNFWNFGVPGFSLISSYNEFHTIYDDATNTDEARFAQILVGLEQTIREIGKLAPTTIAARPSSSILMEASITQKTATNVAGSVSATNARSNEPVVDASVTVTLYNESYDTILGFSSAIFVAGVGYTFSIDYDFIAGTAYNLSFDSVAAGPNTGRALLRI